MTTAGRFNHQHLPSKPNLGIDSYLSCAPACALVSQDTSRNERASGQPPGGNKGSNFSEASLRSGARRSELGAAL